MTFQEKIVEMKEKMDKDREDALKEAGYEPFFKLPKGETPVKFLETDPREVDSKFGKRIVFSVEVNGEKKDLPFSEKNPFLYDLVKALKEGKTELTILRAGEGVDTRYDLK